MPAELTADGLIVQTMAEIEEELRESYKALHGQSTQFGTSSNVSKQIGLYADREAQSQEALQGVFWSQYIATAAGIALDYVLERMGLQRQSAAPSTVVIYAAGTPGQNVDAESLRMSNTSGDIFFNSETFSLSALPDKSIDSITRVGSVATVTIGGGHSFPVNSFVFIEGTEQDEYKGLKEVLNVAGTTFDFNVSGTPATPATGTITAKAGTAFDAESEQTGAIQALAGTIATIEAAVPGVSDVENADDATLGMATESDAEVRARAYASLSINGAATQPAIISKLLNVAGVTFATVFQNVTDFVDVNGLPAHTIRAVVQGGDDDDIWNLLYNEAVAAGIRMDGTEQTTITDANGDEQPVAFSRPTPVRIYVDAGNGLVTNSDPAQGLIFPADGEDRIAANLAAISFTLGGDVWPAKIKEAINKVNGVISSDPEFDTITPPVNQAVISIGATQIANIDSDDVTF